MAFGAVHTFEAVPPIGTVVMLDDQAFEMIGSEPFTRKNGEKISLIVWRSHCPHKGCGVSFEWRSMLAVQLARRCREHSAKRIAVGKQGVKVTVTILPPAESSPHLPQFPPLGKQGGEPAADIIAESKPIPCPAR